MDGYDGVSSLNLAGARLRYIAGSAWSTRRYLTMKLRNFSKRPPMSHQLSTFSKPSSRSHRSWRPCSWWTWP